MTDSHTAEDATVTFTGNRETSEFTHVEVLRGGFVRLSRESTDRVEILPPKKIERIVCHE
jgi:hypothetical protein